VSDKHFPRSRHITNIYSVVKVTRRVETITRARELGLTDQDPCKILLKSATLIDDIMTGRLIH